MAEKEFQFDEKWQAQFNEALARYREEVAILDSRSRFLAEHPLGMKASRIMILKQDWLAERMSLGQLDANLREFDVKTSRRLAGIKDPATKEEIEELAELREMETRFGNKDISDKEFDDTLGNIQTYATYLRARGSEKLAKQILDIRKGVPSENAEFAATISALNDLRERVERERDIRALVNELNSAPKAFWGRYRDRKVVEQVNERAKKLIAMDLVKAYWAWLNKRNPKFRRNEWDGFSKNVENITEEMVSKKVEVKHLGRRTKASVEDLYPGLANRIKGKRKELKGWFPGWDKWVKALVDPATIHRLERKFTVGIIGFVNTRVTELENIKETTMTRLRKVVGKRIKSIEHERKKYVGEVSGVLKKRISGIKRVRGRLARGVKGRISDIETDIGAANAGSLNRHRKEEEVREDVLPIAYKIREIINILKQLFDGRRLTEKQMTRRNELGADLTKLIIERNKRCAKGQKDLNMAREIEDAIEEKAKEAVLLMQEIRDEETEEEAMADVSGFRKLGWRVTKKFRDKSKPEIPQIERLTA